MSSERCQECGFDGAAWTDAGAIEAIGDLPRRWAQAVAGLAGEQLTRRPRADRWSIAEYSEHVGKVLAAMRAVLAAATTRPGINLGTVPEPVFEPVPKLIDLTHALSDIEREASLLAERLAGLTSSEWAAQAIGNGHAVDAHWIARHAVHDATHHLLDVGRLRELLTASEHCSAQPGSGRVGDPESLA